MSRRSWYGTCCLDEKFESFSEVFDNTSRSLWIDGTESREDWLDDVGEGGTGRKSGGSEEFSIDLNLELDLGSVFIVLIVCLDELGWIVFGI